ncbi:MAG: InlB B-repeat-containing protein [Eubacterium sp.]
MKLSYAYVMPVKAYTINTGKTTVYSTVNGAAKSNKIYDTDLCTISQIYDCGWCKVTFPLNSGGTETGYCKISVFMKSGGFIAYTSKQTTTYRRSDLKTTAGYAGSGDKIYILGTSGSAVQIAYPLTAGGWKVGWIPTSAIKGTLNYNANGGSGSMANTFAQYNSTFSLSANKFTKTGYSFSGWNVYRSSDKKWYVSSKGWKTSSEISSNSYTKALYKNQWSGTFDKSWINLGKTNDTFTFYAVWNPNKLTVNYNANGGTINSDTYKIKNNIVYTISNDEKVMQLWKYNQPMENGLYNASTFGLTKTGFIFKGWGTTASGGSVFNENDNELVPSSINPSIKTGSCTSTLYAIWEPITYTIKYDANGGTGAPTQQTKVHNQTLYISSTQPTKNGFEFLGWSKSKTDTTPQFLSGGSYNSNNSVTLYAVWKAIAPPVTHVHEWEKEYTVDIEPTCTESGIKSIHCKTCYETTNCIQVPPTGHHFTITDKIEPSCTQEGYIIDTCTNCNERKIVGTILPTGHITENDNAVAPTCTETGLTAGKHCSLCGLIMVKQKVVEASGHKSVTDNAIASTCDKTGLTEGSHCSVCGEILVNQKTIAKKSHTYKTTTAKATTSKNGSVVTKCTVCGAVKSKSTIYYPKTISLSATSYTYDGKVKKPSVKVVGSNGKAISSSNYTVSYASGRKNIGKYAVKITFKGNYSGTKTLYFYVKPKATSISSVSAGSKKFTVKWKKQATQTTGYQIQYSTSSKFSKAKTVTVGKNSTTSKTVSKLSGKKKYYVRVRTYKTVKINGKATKIYSSWSKAKSVTTKK